MDFTLIYIVILPAIFSSPGQSPGGAIVLPLALASGLALAASASVLAKC